MTIFNLIINGNTYKAFNYNIDLSIIQLSKDCFQVVDDSYQFVMFNGSLRECTIFCDKQ